MDLKQKIAKLKSEFFPVWLKTYDECSEEVSNEHSMFCVCGRLATGLHESSCAKFRKEVEKRTVKKLEHLLNDDNKSKSTN